MMNILGMAFLFIIVFLIALTVNAWAVMTMWNSLIPYLFPTFNKPLDLTQAMQLWCLCNILTTGFNLSSGKKND